MSECLTITQKQYPNRTQWVVEIDRHCDSYVCPVLITLHTVHAMPGITMELSRNEANLLADALTRWANRD